MQPNHTPPESDLPPLASIKVRCSSPRFPPPSTPTVTETPTAGAQRKIGIAVDLSDESAFAVKWAVHQYLRPGDAVILLHVRPTSVLYGADWGSVDLSIVDTDEVSQQKLEDDFDVFTTTKASDLAQPLIDAHIPYKIHIVKDHDMKERLCLEVERLGLSALIMGSRGFGATKRVNDGRLGSVSDYCVRHCVCPVVVVRYPDEKDEAAQPVVSVASAVDDDDEPEYHDASDDRKGDANHAITGQVMRRDMLPSVMALAGVEYLTSFGVMRRLPLGLIITLGFKMVNKSKLENGVTEKGSNNSSSW